MRSGPGGARTILLLHIISARPSKQPLMVRTFLKVYMELGSYFVSARTNKRHLRHLAVRDTLETRTASTSTKCRKMRKEAKNLRRQPAITILTRVCKGGTPTHGGVRGDTDTRVSLGGERKLPCNIFFHYLRNINRCCQKTRRSVRKSHIYI